jgi:DNA-binding CsgD family transcriptional regulator
MASMSRLVSEWENGLGDSAIPPAAPLYGRDGEIEALRGALAAAISGRGRLVLVAGEAGIGKTALVELATAAARERGAVVLGGHCYDLDTAAPYEPWIELLRAYRPGDGLPPLPAGLGNAELLETLSGKDALFEQVAGFLGELARITPVVLLLEDLHWSDQASLDLLRSVARRIPSLRLLLVTTFRDNELTTYQPLHRVLPLLVREARPLRLDLRPLGEEAIRAFAADRYGLLPEDERRLVQHLLRYSEGNPFYLEELLRTLEHERLLRPSGPAWTVGDLASAPVPPLVRHLIEERVARLGAPMQRLLQIAAVIGLVIPPDLWQVTAELDDEAYADAIDQAREANLIHETADRSALRFAHALVREALYGGIALPRRRAWHRRIGHLLAEWPQPDPDAVAHHLLQAGDATASDWLIRAAQRAERRDAAWDAVTRYEQALPLLEQRGDADALAWLHADLAESYRYVDPAKSSAHLDAAERAAQGTGDCILALAIRWLRARLRGFLGQNVFADLQQCVAALDAMSAEERARLAGMGRLNLPSRGLLAQWIAFIGSYDEATAYADAVLADDCPVESAARRNEVGGAHIALALARAGTGQPDAARAAFAAAREQFLANGSTFMAASTLKWELIEVAMATMTEDLEERGRLLGEYARTMARMSSFAVFRGARPLLQVFAPALLEGRWSEARESALAYLRVPAWRVSALAALGDLERRQGKMTAAWGRVRSGIPGGAETAPGNLYFVDGLALQRLAADLALDEGNLVLALTWIEAHDRWLDWSGRILDRPASHLLRARFHSMLGEQDTATDLAHQALARAGAPRQPLALLAAHRALGILAAVRGAFAEARDHLERALVLADACAAPYERALTLLELARLAIAERRGEDAAPLLEEARTICTRLGAVPVLEAISTLAAAPAEPAVSGALAGLTPREIEVLRLVAQGMSYIEVGAHLFISPRTVARHLQSIYGKIEVESRAEAAAFAYAQGLV